MKFLENKKNLPIVIAIAVFFLLGAGGLIAFELGLFSGSQTVASAPPPGPPSGAMPGAPPTGQMMGGPPPGMQGAPNPMRGGPMTPHPMTPNAAGVPGAPAVKVAAVSTNPAVGPDPFYIPGGQQHLPKTAPLKLPLRNLIGPLNLFQLHIPTAPPPNTDNGIDHTLPGPVDQTSSYRLIGVITGSDGVNAILEGADGQSQSVKAGDALSDGSRVQNIQATSLTLRTATGSIVTLPLSSGGADQNTNNFGGQPRPNGPMMGQPFNTQGPNQ